MLLEVADGDQLITAGRDCDIYDRGPLLVLRRSRSGRSQAAEAIVMDYLHTQGYPVPAIEDVSADGTEVLMERIDGPTMLEAIARRPTSLPAQARALAHLHRRLHRLAAPAYLPASPVGQGAQLVHMDLQPSNVILGSRGPVVVDWSNASAGPAAADVGAAWLSMEAARTPHAGIRMKAASMVRSYMVRLFLDHLEREPAVRYLRALLAWKASDPNTSLDEIESMWRVVEREERRQRGLE
jgi:tRNA A-37 threonylcarbamoyl transferase component Bud32